MDNTAADPLIGRVISQYEVVARIGGGGMGVVYKATDLKLGRAVALKFLPPQWSHDDGAKQRFLREAQAASATNHRNICIIHDIAQTDDGQLFIVMAYYEGQTLKQKLEAGPLPVLEALEIAAEIAEGLAKAHAQGVVHRDVKPGNLMVTDDGVKVLDFGLAKFADSLQLTMAGSTIGTVAYMSPEQARGEEADARSDVWALGIVLYEMLIGRVPFTGAYPEAIFYAIKNEPVPPLNGDDRELPAALEALVVRALEKDPERRYQSAREVARDLRLLQGRTVPLDLRTEQLPPFSHGPAHAGDQERATLSWRDRARRAVTPARAIAAVVAMIAVAAGTYAWMTRPVVRIGVAIAPVANHTGEPDLDGYRLALTATLLDELADSPNIRVVQYPRLLEIVRRFVGAGDMAGSDAIQAITTRSGASIVIVPSLEYRSGSWLARAQFRSVALGEVTNTFETEAAPSSLPKDTAQRLMASLANGIQAYFKTNGPGRSYTPRPASTRFRSLDASRAFEQGMNAYEQLEYPAALDAFQRAVTLDDQHAMTFAWQSRVLLILSRGNEAAAAAKRAKQLVTPETSRGDAAFIDAVLAESQVEAAAAAAYYREHAARRPGEALPHIELADFFKRQHLDREAIAAYREALRLDEPYGRPHVDLCQIYVRQNEYPLAEEEARTALNTFRSIGHRGGEAQALLCLGDAQRAQGGTRLADASQSIEAAWAIFESLGLEYSMSRVYQYLGLVAGGERKYPAAARFFEEALSRSRRIGNRQIEGLALMNLGVTYDALGQRTQVLKYYQESRDFYQQIGDEQRAAEQEVNAAALLVEYGTNQDEALRRVRNALATFRKLGSLEFQVFAMEMEAVSRLYAGDHTEARKQLLAALSLAKERKLNNNNLIPSMTVRLADSYVMTGEYEAARRLLEETAATDAGRGDLDVALALGAVFVQLGDLQSARGRLEPAAATIEASGQLALMPRAQTLLGELEYEAGKPAEARLHFSKALANWIDDLPDAASVMAGCDLGLLDALAGKAAASQATVEKSVKHAREMGRLALEAECRLRLARIYLIERRYANALAALPEIPSQGDKALGPALQAEIHYWRGHAMAELRERAGAESETAAAQTIMKELRASLPEPYRESFASKIDIRPVLQDDPIRDLR